MKTKTAQNNKAGFRRLLNTLARLAGVGMTMAVGCAIATLGGGHLLENPG